MVAFFDFNEIFGEFGFGGEFMKSIQREFDEIEKMISSGELKGKWDVKKIEEPGRRGYIIKGRFWSDQPLEPFDPFEPLKPWRRRPTPERHFKIPKTALTKIREPFADLFEEDKTVKIYVELPGEEKDDIQLNVKENEVEVKTEKFYKIVKVPVKNIDIKKTSSKYKNGVLEITIPKKEKLHKENTKKIKID